MTLLRKLAGETAIYGTSYILSRVLHYLLFTFYLTYEFNKNPELYGIYGDLYFYVAIVLVLLTFRMETTYFRYAKEDKPAVTMMSLSFLGGVGGLFLLLLSFFDKRQRIKRLHTRLQFSSFTLVFVVGFIN